MPRAYLDHNATTPPLPEVIALVARVMAEAGNPSAVHGQGRHARHRIESARAQVAALCRARAQDVTFFGSATEATATLFAHFADAPLLRPDSEHRAVLDARPGHTLRLNADGSLDLAGVAAQLRAQEGPVLLAIMAANNETGLLSDGRALGQVVAAARERNPQIHYHVDAVQAAGKMPIDLPAWGCDSLTLSAHKMGGPQGVGALVTRPGFDLRPLIRGGGQERRRRAGTENVAGIAGFGLACRHLTEAGLDFGAMQTLQTRLEHGLRARNPACQIVGAGAPRLPNTTCVLTPGKTAQTLLMQFDLAGVALSSGSACSSGKVGPSHVLQAMGIAPGLAQSALRFSLGRTTSVAEIDRALDVYGAACRAST